MLFITVLFTMALVCRAKVKVLPESCIMDCTDFQKNVTGKDWIALYGIDEMQEVIAGQKLKKHLKFTVSETGSLTMKLRAWDDETNDCLYLTKVLSHSTTVGLNRAEFQLDDDNRQVMRFASRSPDKYLIINTCFLNNELDNDRMCPSSITDVAVLDERSASLGSTGAGEIMLNKIPWDEIADDLKRCSGRKFDDDIVPPVEWTWYGPAECPPQSE